MKNTLQLLALIIIAGAAGFGLQKAITHSDNREQAVLSKPAASVVGQPRPDFSLTDLDGKLRHISEWDGKVLLVNFWATWCPPCKKEIPAFMALQEKYAEQGFQIIGVAIDDEDSVRNFAEIMDMNYPIMAAELASMEIARRYGNRVNALPFTSFVNRQGKITHTFAGEISREQTEKIIKALL
ncbi:MAG: TlpA family protein disulfide reductase [Gammaproteobacteria bacterium]